MIVITKNGNNVLPCSANICVGGDTSGHRRAFYLHCKDRAEIQYESTRGKRLADFRPRSTNVPELFTLETRLPKAPVEGVTEPHLFTVYIKRASSELIL